jgi:hypothetical protein
LREHRRSEIHDLRGRPRVLTYWAIFAYFAVGAAIEVRRNPDFSRRRPLWILGGLLIVVMVGLRYEVGADWQTYEFIFALAGRVGLERALELGDPGYQLLNWSVALLGGEVVWVNLVSAVLFTWGLFRLARLQPDPWLAVLIAVPYMVIVASNYTRQAAALGIVMVGLSSLVRGGSLLRFTFYVALAATFHRTAVAVLPLVIFSRPRQRFLNIIGGLAAMYALFDVFLADSMEQFVENYIEREYSSQGAIIRVSMEVLAASIFLLRRKQFAFPPHEDRIWFYFSIASFGALIALGISPSSTAVDRLSLYLMPLQIVVLGRAPFVYASRQFGTVIVAAYSFAVQFVWLNFATHARYWIPYQVYPLFG